MKQEETLNKMKNDFVSAFLSESFLGILGVLASYIFLKQIYLLLNNEPVNFLVIITIGFLMSLLAKKAIHFKNTKEALLNKIIELKNK